LTFAYGGAMGGSVTTQDNGHMDPKDMIEAAVRLGPSVDFGKASSDSGPVSRKRSSIALPTRSSFERERKRSISAQARGPSRAALPGAVSTSSVSIHRAR